MRNSRLTRIQDRRPKTRHDIYHRRWQIIQHGTLTSRYHRPVDVGSVHGFERHEARIRRMGSEVRTYVKLPLIHSTSATDNFRLRKIIGMIEKTIKWPLVSGTPLSHWTTGRLVILGDAAHAMLPYMSQGGKDPSPPQPYSQRPNFNPQAPQWPSKTPSPSPAPSKK